MRLSCSVRQGMALDPAIGSTALPGRLTLCQYRGMNHVVRPDHLPRTTRAAEGLPRWRWTTAELLRLAELGAFNSDDHFELIGGEIVPMSPAGRLHEVLREDLENLLRSKKTDDVNVVAEPQFNLSDDTYTKTDILVRPASIRSPDLRGPTALLVVEIADTSLD